MSSLSPEKLTEIRAMAEAATPGPWRADTSDGKFSFVVAEVEPSGYIIATGGVQDESAANATFIAACRTDIPALLAEVERLSGERDEAEELLAITHRDGGQHTEAVGFMQSVRDAMGLWSALHIRVDAAESGLSRQSERTEPMAALLTELRSPIDPTGTPWPLPNRHQEAADEIERQNKEAGRAVGERFDLAARFTAAESEVSRLTERAETAERERDDNRSAAWALNSDVTELGQKLEAAESLLTASREQAGRDAAEVAHELAVQTEKQVDRWIYRHGEQPVIKAFERAITTAILSERAVAEKMRKALEEARTAIAEEGLSEDVPLLARIDAALAPEPAKEKTNAE